MSLKNLLELRKKIKSKKPAFVRPESHKRIKLGKSWRRPKGLHSKVRRRLKGYHKHATIGYGSPKGTRYLHKSGLKMVLVCSEKDAEKIRQEECAIIARTVGLKKKIILLKKLNEKNIKVLNIKDVGAYIKDFEEKQKKKAEGRKEKSKAKKKGEEKPKSKLEEKTLTEEEKKEKERKEKDKLLTKKDLM